MPPKAGWKSPLPSRHETEGFDRQHDPEGARLPGQRECAPAKRDDERGVADLRHRLADPEEPEVAVTKRLQDAQSRRGAHRSKAILGSCRNGFVSRACR
jgi:hypothetical protein